MKKLLLIALATLPLSGCGAFEVGVASWAGYSTVCVRETGVFYVQFPSGVAPLITREGEVVPCGSTPKYSTKSKPKNRPQ